MKWNERCKSFSWKMTLGLSVGIGRGMLQCKRGSPASDGSLRRTFTSEVCGVLSAQFTSTLTLFAPVFITNSVI